MGVVLKNVNITGGKLSSTVDAPKGWVRNPDWIDIPDMTHGDNKFYGVLAVYENESNWLDVQIGGGLLSVIDWGDGSPTENASNLVVYSHQYDYNTLSTPVVSDENSRNYKTVLVQLSLTVSTYYVTVDRPSSRGGTANWLDISFDCATTTTFRYTNQRFALKLERLRVYNHSVNNFNTTDNNLCNIRVFDYLTPLAGNFQNSFRYLGEARKSDGSPLDLISPVTTQANATFNYSKFTKFGTVDIPLATQSVGTFLYCQSLLSVGSINLPNANSTQNLFGGCATLKKIGDITTGSSLSNIVQMFFNCFALENINISNCSGITNTTNAFLNCRALKSIILTGITVGFNVSYSMLEADALNALFTSLGTASGSQTIIVTGNPGAATCDTSIATGKGFTVTI
jgi:hypothetical protein